MSERAPVVSPDELDALDSAEVVEGYNDGRAGDIEPGPNRSKSYWHGWRNGMVDGGHREKDDAMAVLAHLYLRRERLRAELALIYLSGRSAP